jgi:hypothetical protein
VNGPVPADRLVLSYLGEAHYHRRKPDDDERPVCQPKRLRGVLAQRFKVERDGQDPCPLCWPET